MNLSQAAAALLLASFLVAPPVRADSQQLMAQRLDLLDQRGYFTPAFQRAVHDLVEAKQAAARTRADEIRLEAGLPDLQRQSDKAKADAAALRKTLTLYAHPEVSDFDALDAAMKNPAVRVEDRLALAQAFVWTYPNDPHQVDAEQDLQQLQRQLAGGVQAVQNAQLLRAAAREALLQRVRARDLSFPEWQSFLQDMSQEDLFTYLGRPETQGPGYWVYSGAWTTDPVTKKKAGLLITFNGTRVIRIELAPYQP